MITWGKNHGYLSFGILLSKGLANSSADWFLSIDLGRYFITVLIWKAEFR